MNNIDAVWSLSATKPPLTPNRRLGILYAQGTRNVFLPNVINVSYAVCDNHWVMDGGKVFNVVHLPPFRIHVSFDPLLVSFWACPLGKGTCACLNGQSDLNPAEAAKSSSVTLSVATFLGASETRAAALTTSDPGNARKRPYYSQRAARRTASSYTTISQWTSVKLRRSLLQLSCTLAILPYPPALTIRAIRRQPKA
ncbi:hypothetical protein BJV74DRAFT_795373 [Russula compacta]|nr:hypothetical protein BJV74DRAFT_795373 [Russula compacta]